MNATCKLTSILCATLISATTSVVQAQRPTAQQGRDLHSQQTIDVVAALTREISRAHDTNTDTYRDAQIARWTLVADMLFLAAYQRDAALRMQISEAVGEPVSTLELAVLDGLTYVPVTSEHDPGEEAELGTRLLAELRRDARPSWHRHEGLRRDLLYVHEVRRAIDGATDPIAALLDLAEDPCDVGGACAAPYRAYGTEARRAIRALAEAHAALGRLRAAEPSGPLWDAVAADLEVDEEVVRHIALELGPHLRLSDELQLTEIGRGGELSNPSLVVVVGPTGIRYGWVPRVSFSTTGAPVAEGDGAPLLPETREVSFGAEPRPIPRALAMALPAVESLAARLPVGAEVAVGSEPTTPAHVFSRVMITLERGNLPATSLRARGADGSVRTLPISVVRSTEDIPSSHVRVHVRLGGYTVRRSGRPRMDVPRIRPEPETGWQFDLDGLRSSIDRTRGDRMALSSMGTVRMEQILAAAFALGRRSDEIVLALY